MNATLKRVFRPVLVRAACWLVPRPLANGFNRFAALSRLSAWFRANREMNCTGDRTALYGRVLRDENLDGPIDYLEFGVYRGDSLRWWCEHITCPDARFYGFDCFQGLPEAWGVVSAGTFDTGGKIPEIDDKRLEFVVGLFNDSLRAFLQRYPLKRRKIIHMDADLYTSTLYVLTQIAHYLRSGDVLIFDEFGSIRMVDHEFRACEDFCKSYHVSIQALGANELLETVAVKVV